MKACADATKATQQNYMYTLRQQTVAHAYARGRQLQVEV